MDTSSSRMSLSRSRTLSMLSSCWFMAAILHEQLSSSLPASAPSNVCSVTLVQGIRGDRWAFGGLDQPLPHAKWGCPHPFDFAQGRLFAVFKG
jgi:hypothetical protein